MDSECIHDRWCIGWNQCNKVLCLDNKYSYVVNAFFNLLICLFDINVFSCCRSIVSCRVLLCVWHVKRVWLKNVYKLSSCDEIGRKMFSTLGAIMNNCHDPESVIQALNHFYDEFSNENCFLYYFSRNWM